MNNLLARLDKYKYGLFFIVALFVVFSSIRMQYGFIDRPDLSYLLNKPPDVIELKLEPMEMVEQRMNATGEVKNAVRDENSNGSGGSSGSSNESYSSAKSLQAAEQNIYDLEQSFYSETGGAEKRAAIQQEMDKRKKEQEEDSKVRAKNSQQAGNNKNTEGTNTSGQVLTSWNLKNRSSVSIPAPGYMCPQGTSGTVVVGIKVDGSGKVVDAKVNSTSSNDDCMTSKALEFARKAKFNYTANQGLQEGTITYTYVK